MECVSIEDCSSKGSGVRKLAADLPLRTFDAKAPLMTERYSRNFKKLRRYSRPKRKLWQSFGHVNVSMCTCTALNSNCTQITSHWKQSTSADRNRVRELKGGFCDYSHTSSKLSTCLESRTLLIRYHVYFKKTSKQNLHQHTKSQMNLSRLSQ